MEDNIKDRLQQEVLALAGKVTQLIAEIKRITTAAAPAAPSEQAPNGFVLMPTEINAVVKLGFAYLDAARKDLPNKSWSFSHAGYRAMVAAAAAAPAAPLPDQPEQIQLQQDHVSRLIHKAWNLGLHADHHGFDKFKAEMAYGGPQTLPLCNSALRAEPACLGLIERYEEMRRALVIQIDNLLDIAERHAWKKDDAEELARTEGAMKHARKVVEPYRYNGNGPMPTTTCGACDGTGNYSTEPDSSTCEECDGTGKIDPTTEEFQ